MNMQTKLLIGVGILGLGAYFAYTLMKDKDSGTLPECPCTGQVTNIQGVLIEDWLGTDEVKFNVTIQNNSTCTNKYVVIIYDENYDEIHKSNQISLLNGQSSTYTWDTEWTLDSADDFCTGYYIEVYCETEPGQGVLINPLSPKYQVQGLVC